MKLMKTELRTTYCIIPFISNVRMGKSGKKKYLSGYQDWRQCLEHLRMMAKRNELSSLGYKNVLKLIVVMDTELTYILKALTPSFSTH